MNVEYRKTLDSVRRDLVSEIFLAVGWGERSPDSLEHAFSQSSFYRFAYIADELVGFGRTVDDGVFYGWVVDLVVLPNYQGLGIGSRILKELESELDSFITTMLVATEGNGGFYERQGWFKQRSAYIYPRSQRQIDVFGERR